MRGAPAAGRVSDTASDKLRVKLTYGLASAWFAMSAIPREGPYRFFFYASDRTEPEHVHVERDDRVAKF